MATLFFDVSAVGLSLVLGPCAGLAAAAPARFPQQASQAPQRASASAKIQRLIDRLVTLGSAEGNFGGWNFPPVPEQPSLMMVRPGERDRCHPAVARLAALGPKALPALLRGLDDRRPTQWTYRRTGFIRVMKHSLELDCREGDAKEVATVRAAGVPEDYEGKEGYIESYTATVGDACFVVIGMITNRAYQIVRYQPSAILVVSSLAKQPALTKAVRALWPGKDQAALADRLFERLVGDYRDLEHPADWAAIRILRFFPERGADFLLRELEQLLAAGEDAPTSVGTLIQSIAWSPVPKVRKKIRSLVLEGSDRSFVFDGIDALADASDPGNFEHLARIADLMRKPGEDPLNGSPSLAGRVLLVNLKTFPARRAEALRRFLQDASHEAKVNCLLACYQVRDVPVASLIPLLGVEVLGEEKYLMVGPGVVEAEPAEDEYREFRICDHAYEVISRALGDHEARCTGTRKEMDARIGALQKRLQGPPATWPFRAPEIARRQADQNKVRLALQASRARIARVAKSPHQAMALSVLDPGIPDAIAVLETIRLLTPVGRDPSTVVEGVWVDHGRESHRDRLDDAQRAAVAEALARRLDAAIAARPTSYPTDAACALAILNLHWSRRPAEALTRFTRQLMGHVAKNVYPRGVHLARALAALELLMQRRAAGAARCVRVLFRAIPASEFQHFQVRWTFYTMLARHDADPEIRKVLKAMLRDRASPWNLTRADLQLSDLVEEMCGGLFESKMFRQALREVLETEHVVGHVFLEAGDPDTCVIDWALRKDHTRWGMAEGDVAGVKPGKGRMRIHHRDVLLDKIANSSFFSGSNIEPRKGPAFRLYWPAAKRKAARQAWLRFLGFGRDR